MCDGSQFINCTFCNTGGIEPQCGMDYESESGDDAVINTVIDGCKFYNNRRTGLNNYNGNDI